MNTVESLKSFLISDPIVFNQKLGNRCQNFCLKNPPPNIFSRLVVGVVIKDVAHICAIAAHIIVGLGKLAISAAKFTFSIPARIWSYTPNYQTIGKEGFVHLGFSGFFFADIFISFTNIINRYPQDLTERVEDFFGRVLQIPKKDAVILKETHKTPQEEAPKEPASFDTADVSQDEFIYLKEEILSTEPSEEEAKELRETLKLYKALSDSEANKEKNMIRAMNHSKYQKKPFCSSLSSSTSSINEEPLSTESSEEVKKLKYILKLHKVFLYIGVSEEKSMIWAYEFFENPKPFRNSLSPSISSLNN